MTFNYTLRDYLGKSIFIGNLSIGDRMTVKCGCTHIKLHNVYAYVTMRAFPLFYKNC